MTEEEKRLQKLEEENEKLRKEIKEVDEKNLQLTIKEKRIKRRNRKIFLAQALPILTFVVVVFEGWLIYRQTNLFSEQNAIANKQTNLVENQTALMDTQVVMQRVQNEMFQNQNDLVTQQNEKFDLQNKMFGNQNTLVQNQNSLIQHQSERLDQQTYLQEADRRSALVFLMGNIFDAVDRELINDNNINRTLSPQLIGRIIALSHSFQPYKFLVGDSLTKSEYSPERGQLLISLVNSKINSLTLDEIYKRANFNNAYLKGANFEGAYLSNLRLIDVELSEVEFKDANLSKLKIYYSNLKRTSFYEANLEKVSIGYSNLEYASFVKAKMCGVVFSESNLNKANFRNAYLIKDKNNMYCYRTPLYLANIDSILIDEQNVYFGALWGGLVSQQGLDYLNKEFSQIIKDKYSFKKNTEFNKYQIFYRYEE
jgi:uncharacterized protein YjbI with pentapeptide repeats